MQIERKSSNTLSFSGIGMGWPVRKDVKTPFLLTGMLGSCMMLHDQYECLNKNKNCIRHKRDRVLQINSYIKLHFKKLCCLRKKTHATTIVMHSEITVAVKFAGWHRKIIYLNCGCNVFRYPIEIKWKYINIMLNIITKKWEIKR